MKLLAGIATLLLTGLWVATESTGATLGRVALISHIVVALLVVPPALRGLYLHLKRSMPALRPGGAVAVQLILVAGFLLPYLPVSTLPSLLAGAVLVALSIAGITVWVGPRRWIGTVRWTRSLVAEVAHLLLWGICAATGPAIVLLGGGRSLSTLFLVHRVFGLAMVAFGLVWLVRTARRRAASGGSPAAPRLAYGAVGGAVLLVLGQLVAWPGDGFTVHLSAIPFEERRAEERDALPMGFDPELLDISESCGGPGGCHAGILDDHRRSTHAMSMHPPHIAKNLDLLVSETGNPQDVATCAGCHQPQGLAHPGGVPRGFDEGINLSCVSCHAIRAVAWPEEDRHRSSVRFVLNESLLAPFAAAEAEGRPLEGWDRYWLEINPAGHGRAFSPDVIRSDDLCQACHRAQIVPSEAAPSCATCHMPLRAELLDVPLDDPEALRQSHLFPGSNVATAHMLGDEIAERAVREWTNSDVYAEEIPFRAYGVDPERPEPGTDRRGSFFYVHAAVDAPEPPRAGEPWSFDVVVANTFVGHGFPAGPMDLLEVWLEVEVLDRNGAVLLASGQLDPTGRVPADARRLGGRALDAEGREIEHYRVWRMKKEVIDRQLNLGEETADRFEIDVPSDATGWLTVRARWRYRELNPDFVAWAYGDTPVEVPIIDVAEVFYQAEVEPGGAP